MSRRGSSRVAYLSAGRIPVGLAFATGRRRTSGSGFSTPRPTNRRWLTHMVDAAIVEVRRHGHGAKAGFQASPSAARDADRRRQSRRTRSSRSAGLIALRVDKKDLRWIRQITLGQPALPFLKIKQAIKKRDGGRIPRIERLQ